LRKEERFSNKLSQNYKSRPDYILLFIVVALLSVGVLMVFSASPTMALRLGDSYYYLKRHFSALIIGLIALYTAMKIDYFNYKNISNILIAASAVLLFIVLIPGVGIERGGASRWLYFSIFSFQPAEFAKLALIIYISKELSSKPLLSAVLPVIGITLMILFLLLEQPDLGTALIILLICFIMLYLSGISIKPIRIFFFLSLIAVLILSITSSYRFRRIMAFLNPWNDPQGTGFHIIQSLIAVGSGGLFGLGLGGSKQKFFYLPQNYTDFIFAIFCEEMGFMGAIGIILLFFIFIGRGIRIIKNTPDNFSMLLSGGIIFWLGFQAIINMCVVLGIVPTTGIPLPFISYGGTSIVLSLYSIGILLNISQYRSVVHIQENKIA
jgi:cell division protein FtsW